MVYTSISITSKAGKKLTTLGTIMECYFKEQMGVDVLNVFIIGLDLGVGGRGMDFLRLFIITKVPQGLEKMEKLETVFIKNYYN